MSVNDQSGLTRARALPQYRQFQVVGRHLPTEAKPEPEVFRMKLWALDDVKARSKFWCVRRRDRERAGKDEVTDAARVGSVDL